MCFQGYQVAIMIDFNQNINLKTLPPHLRQYVVNQPYANYTPVNQAVWRYVMRKNVDYLSKVAHESYLEGLKQTGISIDGLLFRLIFSTRCFSPKKTIFFTFSCVKSDLSFSNFRL